MDKKLKMNKIINCNKFLFQLWLSYLVEIFNQVFVTWVSIFLYMLKQHFKLLSMVFVAINFFQLHRLPLMMAYSFILNSRSVFQFSSVFCNLKLHLGRFLKVLIFCCFIENWCYRFTGYFFKFLFMCIS